MKRLIFILIFLLIVNFNIIYAENTNLDDIFIKIEYPEYIPGFPMIEIYLDTDKNSVYDIKISIDRNHPTDYMYLVDPEGKFNNGKHLKGSQTLYPTYKDWSIVPEWKCKKCN